MKQQLIPWKSGLSTALIAGAIATLGVLPAARATLPSHNVSAGNITVIQNDPGNTTNSVTTLLSLSINDFRVRGSGLESDTNSPLNNRGDFAVQAGPDPASNFTNGILMCSVTENGRDNGEGTGTNYCVSMVDNQRTNINDQTAIVGAYWLNVNNAANAGAGNSPEYNINLAAAWFPYTHFLGGLARNHGPNDELGQGQPGAFTNGGAMNQLISSPQLVLGSNFIDLGSGRSHVVLTNLGIDSRVDGILLVSGAKNESANIGLSAVNTTNGGWNLFIKDDGQATLTGFEQDPIAFVFIPKTNATLISGRFLGDATIEMFSDTTPQFTVTSNSAGTYELKVLGHAATNGVLIISPEGGRTVNQDNIVSYRLNDTLDGWIIESRDVPVVGLEAIPAAEPVVSFVFIPGPTPGFSVIPTNNLLTTETGDQATFTVALHTKPSDDVTIALSSSNTAEGTNSPSSLTFTTNDWNVPQTATITGQDDGVADGSVAYSIVLAPAVSTDLNYNGLDPDNVSVLNADNEGGITVTPTSGLITTEAGGQATFTIRLNTQPGADVTIGLSSSDATEGTVSPASLTFTNGTADLEQTLTITGMNDFVDDGDVAYTIITAPAASTDPSYNGRNAADVSVSNTDNDTTGVTVSAAGPAGLTVVEGRTNGYIVALNSEPAADVTVNIASSNTSQGGTVSPASLTFTPGNWSNAQPVTVTGADDLVADGNATWAITNSMASGDSLYAALSPIPVLMTTLDNEAVITLPSGDLIYGTGLAAIGVDGRATILDPNTASYDAATLAVTLTANGISDDRLEIRNTGTGSGQIGVSGNSVTYGGVGIGTFGGGVGTAPLVVTFNSTATVAAAEALLRNVTFRTLNNNPTQNRRSVSVALAHADGGTGSATTGVRVGLLRFADFQEGTDHGYGLYSGEADCHLRQADPDTPYPAGGAGGLLVDWPDAGVQNAFHVLMRFENIFGDGPGLIPTNAVIVSADLILRVPPEDPNSMGDGSPLYRMLIPWNAGAETWTSMGNGVDQNDVESRSAFDSAFGLANGDANTTTGTILFSVAPDIEAWRNGEGNYGWVMPGWIGRTDGTTISPGEAANISDRPRLRVLWLPADTASLSFRQNVNDYTNAADTRIRQTTPDVEYSTITGVFVDWAVSGNTNNDEQVLLRFDNIIGSETNQIPTGAIVHAAILDLGCTIGNAMGDGGKFHAMLQSWQDTNTWNELINGITADDVEAVAAPTAVAGNATLNPNVQAGFLSFELTPDVRAWVSGTRPNYGWVILPWPNGGDGWGFGTAEAAAEADRPRLRVFYTPGAPSIVLLPPVWSPTSVQVRFTGEIGVTYTVLRAASVGGTYGSIGTATVQPDGTATFPDNAPLTGAAFYRVSFP